MDWKPRFKEKKYYWILFVIIVALGLQETIFGNPLFGTLSYGLLATVFGLAGTIFIVERLIKSQREQEWETTRKVLFFDLRHHIAGCILTLLSSYDVKPNEYFTKNDSGRVISKPDIVIWNEQIEKLKTVDVNQIELGRFEQAANSSYNLEQKSKAFVTDFQWVLKGNEVEALFHTESLLHLYRTGLLGPYIYHRKHGRVSYLDELVMGQQGRKTRFIAETESILNSLIKVYRIFGGHDNFSMFQGVDLS